jgi:hypothetical protein
MIEKNWTCWLHDLVIFASEVTSKQSPHLKLAVCWFKTISFYKGGLTRLDIIVKKIDLAPKPTSFNFWEYSLYSKEKKSSNLQKIVYLYPMIFVENKTFPTLKLKFI